MVRKKKALFVNCFATQNIGLERIVICQTDMLYGKVCRNYQFRNSVPFSGRYKIYNKEAFVASLEPDGQDFLHVCQNPGDRDLEILHLLAEQIKLRHPRASKLGDLENIKLDVDKINPLLVVTKLG